MTDGNSPGELPRAGVESPPQSHQATHGASGLNLRPAYGYGGAPRCKLLAAPVWIGAVIEKQLDQVCVAMLARHCQR